MGKQCMGRRPLRNEKNRKRNQLLNFHLTPEDKEENIHFYTQKCGFSIAGTELDGNVRVARLVLERK